MLAWSVGATFIPFLPGSWTKRAVDMGSKALKKTPPLKSTPKVEAKPPAPKLKPPAKKPPVQKTPKKAPLKERAYNSPKIGRQSSVFGAKQLGGAVSGWMNNNNILRVGWSTHKGMKTFRISFGPSIGWWKNKEIILFRGKW